MSYVTLEAARAVLLFADLQAGIVERTVTQDLARLRRAVFALAKLARLCALPAIVTTAPSTGEAVQVIPEIATALGALPHHLRTTTDAFTHAGTRDAIAGTQRTILLISGVATEIIVQHTALSAVASRLQVQVVVDACGGLSERTEEAAFRRLAMAGVETTCVASIAGQLARDITQEQGQKVLGVLYELLSS